ncbi:hypothetical protein BDZ97DRAFT_1390278 [Flammula alnicola]|nr:hypothetical protein BDZ97DRAFT_1390278 [Flammula alnicola]
MPSLQVGFCLSPISESPAGPFVVAGLGEHGCTNYTGTRRHRLRLRLRTHLTLLVLHLHTRVHLHLRVEGRNEPSFTTACVFAATDAEAEASEDEILAIGFGSTTTSICVDADARDGNPLIVSVHRFGFDDDGGLILTLALLVVLCGVYACIGP